MEFKSTIQWKSWCAKEDAAPPDMGGREPLFTLLIRIVGSGSRERRRADTLACFSGSLLDVCDKVTMWEEDHLHTIKKHA